MCYAIDDVSSMAVNVVEYKFILPVFFTSKIYKIHAIEDVMTGEEPERNAELEKSECFSKYLCINI